MVFQSQGWDNKNEEKKEIRKTFYNYRAVVTLLEKVMHSAVIHH